MTEPYWNAKHGEYIKCPVEGCKHFGIIITKAHCRVEHQMSREEVRRKYGLPKSFSFSKSNRKQVEDRRHVDEEEY